MKKETKDQKITRLEKWVRDLQTGQATHCAYCGYQVGPGSEESGSMTNTLTKHIEKCPVHPMTALKKRIRELERLVEDYRNMIPPRAGIPGVPN